MHKLWTSVARSLVGGIFLLGTTACSNGVGATQSPALTIAQEPRIVEVTRVVTSVVTVVATPPPATVVQKEVVATKTAVPPTHTQQGATATATTQPATATSEPPSPQPAANIAQVINGGNLRDAPGGAVLGQVCPGDTATLLQSQGEWMNIQIAQVVADCVSGRVAIGASGWLHNTLLTVPTVPIPTTTPAPTREIEAVNATQRIGPIRDSSREEGYSTEITLQQVRWSTGDNYHEPKPGKIYAIVSVKIKNLGPSPMRYIGPRSFVALDAQGVLNDSEIYIGDLTDDCDLETVDLISGGSTEGCIAFEVPQMGQLSFIFAPYQYEGLKQGRYLSFALRP